MTKTTKGRLPALTSDVKPAEVSKTETKKPNMPSRSSAKFRLLPLTLMMMVLMLGVRIHDLYKDGMKLREMMFPNAEAQEAKAKAATETKSSGGDAKAAETKEAAADAPKEASGEKPAGESKEASSDKDSKDKAAGEKTDAPDIKLAKLADQPGLSTSERKHDYSNIELDILQSLAQRRDQLEERSKEVDLKEKLLEATEMRINDKVNEIKGLKVEVQKLLDEYNTKEKAKVQGLVKIYENMKPKDAAQIFNELEMPILLEVVDQMSARKVAPILANMDPKRAKDVTRELSEYRKLREIPKNISQK